MLAVPSEPMGRGCASLLNNWTSTFGMMTEMPNVTSIGASSPMPIARSSMERWTR